MSIRLSLAKSHRRRKQAGSGSPVARWAEACTTAALRAAAAAGLCAGVLLAPSAPAEAQSPSVTYCEQNDVSVCAGPSTMPHEDISGSQQRQIQQRLQQLRCEGSDDPACAGGAAADSVSYEGLGVFVSADYQHKNKTATDFELGYESDSVGPTIGVDYRLGTSGVIGGAFDYSHAFGDYKGSYGDFDTDTYTLVLYGSYYPTDQSFIDLALGVGRKEFENEHIDEGGGASTVKGQTDGFEFTADLIGGYDFSFGAFTVGPRVGLHYKRTDLNSFTETSADPAAIANTYLDQDDDSLTGTIGAQASYAISTNFGVVVPQINAEYVREFLDDREDQNVILDCCGPITFKLDQPDRNHFNLGAGVVVVLPEGISPFLNYEAEIANYLEETHTVTAGVRMGF
jgi:outer membrane autotransporter protein